MTTGILDGKLRKEIWQIFHSSREDTRDGVTVGRIPVLRRCTAASAVGETPEGPVGHAEEHKGEGRRDLVGTWHSTACFCLIKITVAVLTEPPPPPGGRVYAPAPK